MFTSKISVLIIILQNNIFQSTSYKYSNPWFPCVWYQKYLKH